MSEDLSRVVALTSNVNLEPNDPQRLAALCGPLDQNLKHLEQRLGVHIRNRGNVFQVSGPEQRVEAARALLSQLYRETNGGGGIDPDMVHLFLQESGVDQLLARHNPTSEAAEPGDDNGGVIRTGRKSVKPRGGNQVRYTQRIHDHDVSFGIGPAGTGKTYLAVACAVEALESQQVSRIVLVRPAVEAGEKLVFCPVISHRRSILIFGHYTTRSTR